MSSDYRSSDLHHPVERGPQCGPPPPAYETAGWDQLVAMAGTLPMEWQEWMRTDLAARQQPGRLMAAVIGRRVRYADDLGEPAALLIYAHVIVVTSGPGAGSSVYLRSGSGQVVEAVVGELGLEEVTVHEVHMVELGPPGQQSVAIDALRSLPWVEVRELDPPGGMSRLHVTATPVPTRTPLPQASLPSSAQSSTGPAIPATIDPAKRPHRRSRRRRRSSFIAVVVVLLFIGYVWYDQDQYNNWVRACYSEGGIPQRTGTDVGSSGQNTVVTYHYTCYAPDGRVISHHSTMGL